MAPQLSYSEQAAAFAGLLGGDSVEGSVIDSGLNGETSAGMPFGIFVVASAGETIDTAGTPPLEGTPGVYKLPAAASGVSSNYRNGGFVLHSHEYDKRLDFDVNGSILPKRQLNILKKGRVWVQATTAMALSDDVFVRFTVNGALALGTIGNTADSGKAQKLWGARVTTPITAAGLCEIAWDAAAFVVGDQAP